MTSVNIVTFCIILWTESVLLKYHQTNLLWINGQADNNYKMMVQTECILGANQFHLNDQKNNSIIFDVLTSVFHSWHSLEPFAFTHFNQWYDTG